MRPNTLAPMFVILMLLAGTLWAQPPRNRVQMTAYRPCSIQLSQLRLLDGRRLYRGPRSLRYAYPYLVAANEDDRTAGVAWEVTLRDAHRVFARPATDTAAREFLTLMFPAIPVATVEQYRAMAEVVRRTIAGEPSWKARVEAGEPDQFGVRVTRSDEGPAVAGLLLMCGGAGALDVEHVTIGFPDSGPFRVVRDKWIHGPPQSWQTSGAADPDRQRAMWDEVQTLRRALMRALIGNRDPVEFGRVLRRRPTYANAVLALGPPDEMIGSGRLIYRYAFADGSAAIIVSAGEDRPVFEAHRVRSPGKMGSEVIERWLDEGR